MKIPRQKPRDLRSSYSTGLAKLRNLVTRRERAALPKPPEPPAIAQPAKPARRVHRAGMPAPQVDRPALEAVRLRKCADGIWRLAPPPAPEPPARPKGPPIGCDDVTLRFFGAALIENAVESVREAREGNQTKRATGNAKDPRRALLAGIARGRRQEYAAHEALAWIDGNGLERCIGMFGLRVSADAVRRGARMPAPALAY